MLTGGAVAYVKMSCIFNIVKFECSKLYYYKITVLPPFRPMPASCQRCPQAYAG